MPHRFRPKLRPPLTPSLIICAATLWLTPFSALAQNTLILSLIPRSTEPLQIGDTVTVDLIADVGGISAATAIAAFRFDIVGSTLSGATPLGTLTGDVNRQVFSNGASDGTPSGPSLRGYGGTQLPAILGGGNPTMFLGSFTFLFEGVDPATGQPGAPPDTHVSFTLTNFKPPAGVLNVYISPTGTLSRVGNGLITGEHFVQIIPAEIPITPIPVPGTLACAAAMIGLAASRRRRHATHV